MTDHAVTGRNRLSLSPLTVMGADPLELIEAAAAGGFNSISLRLVPPLATDTIVQVVGDEALIRRIEQRLDETGLDILDVEAIWLTPETSVERLLPALETAARLRVRYLLVGGNDPDEARATANLAHLCEAARPFGLKAMLEFIPFCHTGTLAAALRLVRGAAQPNVGILVDALHLSRSGGTPEDLRAIDASLLDYCHLCDAPANRPPDDLLRAEARGGRLYPGEGELPLAALLDALPAGLPIGVEAPCARDAYLPPIERGRRCGEATHAFLQRYRRSG